MKFNINKNINVINRQNRKKRKSMFTKNCPLVQEINPFYITKVQMPSLSMHKSLRIEPLTLNQFKNINKKNSQNELYQFLQYLLSIDESEINEESLGKLRLIELLLSESYIKDKLFKFMEQQIKLKGMKNEFQNVVLKTNLSKRKTISVIHQNRNESTEYLHKQVTNEKLDEMIQKKQKDLAQLQENQNEVDIKLRKSIELMKEIENNLNILKRQYKRQVTKIEICQQKDEENQMCNIYEVNSNKVNEEQKLFENFSLKELIKNNFEVPSINNISLKFKKELVLILCVMCDHLKSEFVTEDVAKIEFYVKNIIETYESIITSLMQSNQQKLNQIKKIDTNLMDFKKIQAQKKIKYEKILKDYSLIHANIKNILTKNLKNLQSKQNIRKLNKIKSFEINNQYKYSQEISQQILGQKNQSGILCKQDQLNSTQKSLSCKIRLFKQTSKACNIEEIIIDINLLKVYLQKEWTLFNKIMILALELKENTQDEI